MDDCKNLQITDVSIGPSDIFDHPNYAYFCNKHKRRVISCIHCKPERCKDYNPK